MTDPRQPPTGLDIASLVLAVFAPPIGLVSAIVSLLKGKRNAGRASLVSVIATIVGALLTVACAVTIALLSVAAHNAAVADSVRLTAFCDNYPAAESDLKQVSSLNANTFVYVNPAKLTPQQEAAEFALAGLHKALSGWDEKTVPKQMLATVRGLYSSSAAGAQTAANADPEPFLDGDVQDSATDLMYYAEDKCVGANSLASPPPASSEIALDTGFMADAPQASQVNAGTIESANRSLRTLIAEYDTEKAGTEKTCPFGGDELRTGLAVEQAMQLTSPRPPTVDYQAQDAWCFYDSFEVTVFTGEPRLSSSIVGMDVLPDISFETGTVKTFCTIKASGGERTCYVIWITEGLSTELYASFDAKDSMRSTMRQALEWVRDHNANIVLTLANGVASQ